MSIVNITNPTELSGFYVVYKGSTHLEKKGIYGISHLMEHLVCKAFDPFQDELDTLGISHNAYTSANEVVFHMKGLDESLSKWRNKYVDLLGEFNVSKEEFENEKNIVIQEYMDSFNDQSSNHWLNLERKKFGYYNPIGSLEDLNKISYMDCLNYFEKQYLHPSMIINVSKNIEFGMDLDFKTNEIDKTYKMGNYPLELQRDTEYKGKVSLLMISDMVNENFAEINFINNMLSFGLQSPFYNEIREKRGLVYYIGAQMNRMHNQGFNSIYTMSSAENIDTITDIIGTIFGDLDKFMTKKRFDLIKTHSKLKLKEKAINQYASVGKWMSPDGWSTEDIIDDITYEKIMEIAKEHCKIDNFTISRDDEEFQ